MNVIHSLNLPVLPESWLNDVCWDESTNFQNFSLLSAAKYSLKAKNKNTCALWFDIIVSRHLMQQGIPPSKPNKFKIHVSCHENCTMHVEQQENTFQKIKAFLVKTLTSPE